MWKIKVSNFFYVGLCDVIAAERVKTSALIAASEFSSYFGHVVAFLDSALYYDYFCLVASSKQQVYVRSQASTAKVGKMVSTSKRVRICRKESATVNCNYFPYAWVPVARLNQLLAVSLATSSCRILYWGNSSWIKLCQRFSSLNYGRLSRQ